MTINLTIPDIQELKPRITVFGVGGAGGNAGDNMISSGLDGVDFVCANTDAQALALSKSQRIISRLCRTFPREHPPCPIRSDKALETAIVTPPDARDPTLVAKLDAVAGRVLKA